MQNFDAGVAGKPGSVEGENGGEAVHQHGGDQPCIVCRLPGNPILNDKALPDRINRRGSGNRETCSSGASVRPPLPSSTTPSVLGSRPRGHHPQLEQVLRNDVKLAAARGQALIATRAVSRCGCDGCKVRSSVLVSVSTRLDQVRIDALSAHSLVGENRGVGSWLSPKHRIARPLLGFVFCRWAMETGWTC